MKAMKMYQNSGQNLEAGPRDAMNGPMAQNANTGSQLLLGLEDGSIVLTETDVVGLLYMIEEEKMAMDLYDSFAEQTGSIIFDRISDSELRHMSTLLQVAEAADIDLSVISTEAGVFTDQHIQELYDTLLAQGSASFDAAIDVGIIVEETDIADLQEYATSDEIGLLGVVYDHLEVASEHHLAAFTQYDIVAA
jgi:hypothetical protein